MNKDWEDFVLGAGAGALFMGVLALCLLPEDRSSSWREKYYTLSCSSRGLELNKKNKGLLLCQDPKTKALFEVE